LPDVLLAPATLLGRALASLLLLLAVAAAVGPVLIVAIEYRRLRRSSPAAALLPDRSFATSSLAAEQRPPVLVESSRHRPAVFARSLRRRSHDVIARARQGALPAFDSRR